MKLRWFTSDHGSEGVRKRYPHGYWYASTENGDYNADGPDPLTAVSNLALRMESALADHRRALEMKYR